MSIVDKAIQLANEGFYVFPLHQKSKISRITDYYNRATKDPEEIKKFWFDPIMEIEQPYNLGISTSKFKEDLALVVVDIDNSEGKNGEDEIIKLECLGFEFPPTRSQTTPRGGRHLIYYSKEAVKQGTSVLAPHVDIRSRGGYIAAWPSVLNEGEYKIENDLPIAECPKWILDVCGRVEEKEINKEKIDKINEKTAKERAKHYLLKEAPLAVEGDGGDEATFKVAAMVKDFGLGLIDTYELMLDEWNTRCSPPWGPEALKRKVENAFSYGINPQGSMSPEADFNIIGEHGEALSFLDQMNKEFALVFNNSEYFILHETVDEKGRYTINHLSEITFKKMFSKDTVQQGKGKSKSKADIWLDWTGRREYAGLCFKPELEANNNYYNLWTGFTCKPKKYSEANDKAKKGFDMFIEHAKQNICANDERLFEWLMGYFAHMFQKPYEKPLTTIVFRGGKGVGKNVFFDRLGRILGRQYIVLDSGNRVASNFNSYLDSCICMVLDEAFWSGDKRAESTLKSLTTSKTIMIERKGRDIYEVDNFLRIGIIGNEDWLVPASADERRYAVFNVGDGRKQDLEFFHDMRVYIDECGGDGVLLDYFKSFDTSKVNVNLAPNTVALQEQKIESLSPFEDFWFQCLVKGEIMFYASESTWPEAILPSQLRSAFVSYCKDRQIRSWISSDTQITRSLKKICSNLGRKWVGDKKNRVMHRGLPSLEMCRKDFETYLKSEIDWDEL